MFLTYLTSAREEIARVLRHAIVPFVLLAFAGDWGPEWATAFGEAIAVTLSYVAVLGWSKFQEMRAKAKAAADAEAKAAAEK